MIGCSGSRVSTTNEKKAPCWPWPPLASFSALPSRQRIIGPELSLRPPQPPTPIILLYSFQPGNELSAACHVILKRLLGLRRPIRAVVVGNDHAILRELRLEIRDVVAAGGHIDGKQSATFQGRFEQRRGVS